MAETRVNTYTSNVQSQQSVAMDADGDFVVVWASRSQDDPASASTTGVYGQRYNASGTAQGSEFRINSYTSNNQFNPSVALDVDGDFVVVWQSTNQDGSNHGIFGQRYNASGLAQGSEFQVNSYTANAQAFPAIAMDADGDFVVVWQSNVQDGSFYGIYGQRYSAAGVAQGGEFLVNTYTSSHQRMASVAMDTDGDFVVVWQSNGQDGSFYGIYGQRYNASGVAQGAEFKVNTYTSSYQYSPAVAMDTDGDFVVVWQSYGQEAGGSAYGIYGQRYNAAGVAQGTEFLVNTYTSYDQIGPSVAMEADGDFVVTWQSNGQDGSGNGVYSQWYRADGTPEGSEALVNTTTLNSQYAPSAAMASNGTTVVTWVDSAQDGNTNGVFMDMVANPTCFLRGTLILTSRGEVAVERLREGDLVATRFGGLRPIRWIGTQRFHPRFAGPTSSPIRFAPGSLGQGIPIAELFVSPGHAMLVGEVLAHAGALVNGTTITQPRFEGDSIDYFHLDLGQHDCVLANGAWAESYFEDHNRDSFHNAADFHARFPDHQPHRQETCLAIVTAEHPAIVAIRQRLTPPQPAIAAPHLMADGTPVMLRQEGEGTWRASIPAGARDLRLVCRSTCPAERAISTDQRRLGIMVRDLELNGRAVPLDTLGQGWHALEHDGVQAWRWTDGNALLPHQAAPRETHLMLRGWHPASFRAGAEAGGRIVA